MNFKTSMNGLIMNVVAPFTGLAAGLLFSSVALSADIGTDNQQHEIKSKKDFYAGFSIAPEVFVFDLEDAAIDGLIANTFVGIGGTAQLCKQGLGSFDFIDLCLGGHAFKSLTTGSEQAEVLGQTITSETDIFTYGAFGQVKLNAGGLFVGPYAGVRRVDADLSNGLIGIFDVTETEDTAVFGGTEVGFNAFNRRVELGLSGEAGTSVSDNEFNYFKGNLFLRAKF